MAVPITQHMGKCTRTHVMRMATHTGAQRLVHSTHSVPPVHVPIGEPCEWTPTLRPTLHGDTQIP